MYYDAVKIVPLEGFRLHIAFADGKEGIFDCTPLIETGGVFRALSSPDVFHQTTIEDGVITWPGDMDIAPETVYAHATGSPLPAWMAADTLA